MLDTCIVQAKTTDYIKEIVAEWKIQWTNEPRYSRITVKMNDPAVSRYIDTLKVRYRYRVVPRYFDNDTIWPGCDLGPAGGRAVVEPQLTPLLLFSRSYLIESCTRFEVVPTWFGQQRWCGSGLLCAPVHTYAVCTLVAIAIAVQNEPKLRSVKYTRRLERKRGITGRWNVSSANGRVRERCAA